MELRQLIRDCLSEAKLMQLATSTGDQPWVCNVWFAADDDMNIYWFSSTTRRHSDEVLKNEKVAGAMALPVSPQDKGRGLQFEGIAEILTEEKDIAAARAVYTDRIFSKEQIDTFMALPDRPHRFYRIRPTRFVLFDTVNFPDNSRQEYSL